MGAIFDSSRVLTRRIVTRNAVRCIGLLSLIYSTSLYANGLADDKLALNTKGDLVTNPETGKISAVINLGAVPAGKHLDITVRLFNRTDSDFRFNSLFTACSCTKIRPEQGVIKRDDQLEFQLRLSTSPNPKSIRSAGGITFLNEGSMIGDVRFAYNYGMYVGFKSRYVESELLDGATKVEMRIPVAVGDLADFSKYDLSVEGVDAKLQWEYDAARKLILIELESSEKETRSFNGRLVLSNRNGGSRSTCTIVVRPQVPVKVLPSAIRLLENESGAFSGVFFTRAEKIDDLEPTSVSATVSVKGNLITCKRSNTQNLSLSKHEFSVSRKQYESLFDQQQNTSTNKWTKANLQLAVSYNAQSQSNKKIDPLSRIYQVTVPITFYPRE